MSRRRSRLKMACRRLTLNLVAPLTSVLVLVMTADRDVHAASVSLGSEVSFAGVVTGFELTPFDEEFIFAPRPPVDVGDAVTVSISPNLNLLELDDAGPGFAVYRAQGPFANEDPYLILLRDDAGGQVSLARDGGGPSNPTEFSIVLRDGGEEGSDQISIATAFDFDGSFSLDVTDPVPGSDAISSENLLDLGAALRSFPVNRAEGSFSFQDQPGNFLFGRLTPSQPIPEPGSVVLLVVGMLAGASAIRRRSRQGA